MKKFLIFFLVLTMVLGFTGCFEGVVSSDTRITSPEGAGTRTISFKIYKNGALSPDNSGDQVKDMDKWLPGGAQGVYEKMKEVCPLKDAVINLDKTNSSYDLITVTYSFNNIAEYNTKTQTLAGVSTITDTEISNDGKELVFTEPTENLQKIIQWVLDAIYGETGNNEIFSNNAGGAYAPISKSGMTKMFEMSVEVQSKTEVMYAPYNTPGQSITVINKLGEGDKDKTKPKTEKVTGYDNTKAPLENLGTQLKCVDAPEWTDLFKRTDGWLGSDGIYSIPLDGKDQIGSGTSTTKTFFTFCDTNLGTVDSDTFNLKLGWRGANNTAAMLTGTEPDPEKIDFKFNYDPSKAAPYSNLYPGRVWPTDGIAINGSIYLLTHQVDDEMRPLQINMVRIPIVNDQPDFAHQEITQKVPLLYLQPNIEIGFGAGIFDNSEIAGAPNPDGYVYIYGFRNIINQGMKKLIVARVPRNDYGDVSKWRFYNKATSEWVSDISVLNNDGACLADRIAPELSVTYINSGIYKGKYILVYQRDTISNKLVYRIGESPVGPFGDEVHFYTCKEPEIYASSYPNNTVIVYNAKAHPHLSKEGELLISYNVNLWGALASSTEIYRPRFVKLKLDEFAAAQPVSKATTNVALGKKATASHSGKDAYKAVNGSWSSIKEDKWSGASLDNKWLQVDLGKDYLISRWAVKHASVAGELTAYNTQEFRLQMSTDGKKWKDIDAVDYNIAPVTDRTVNPFTARYVRLFITKPAQGADEVARIYEFEVYGVDKSVLKAKIADAKDVKYGFYTNESVKVLKEKLKAAEKLDKDLYVSQEEVDKAVESLQAAINGLVKKHN